MLSQCPLRARSVGRIRQATRCHRHVRHSAGGRYSNINTIYRCGENRYIMINVQATRANLHCLSTTYTLMFQHQRILPSFVNEPRKLRKQHTSHKSWRAKYRLNSQRETTPSLLSNCPWPSVQSFSTCPDHDRAAVHKWCYLLKMSWLISIRQLSITEMPTLWKQDLRWYLQDSSQPQGSPSQQWQ